MKNPARLSHGELAKIVTEVLQILYGEERQDGSWTYAADKEWCGGDVCQDAAGLLDRYGLVPEADGHGEPMEPAAILGSRPQVSSVCRYILSRRPPGAIGPWPPADSAVSSPIQSAPADAIWSKLPASWTDGISRFGFPPHGNSLGT